MEDLLDSCTETLKRTPPILFPLVGLLALMLIVVAGTVQFLFWLIGFYQCKSCYKLKHIIAEPKKKLVGGKTVCKTCEYKY